MKYHADKVFAAVVLTAINLAIYVNGSAATAFVALAVCLWIFDGRDKP